MVELEGMFLLWEQRTLYSNVIDPSYPYSVVQSIRHCA